MRADEGLRTLWRSTTSAIRVIYTPARYPGSGHQLQLCNSIASLWLVTLTSYFVTDYANVLSIGITSELLKITPEPLTINLQLSDLLRIPAVPSTRLRSRRSCMLRFPGVGCIHSQTELCILVYRLQYFVRIPRTLVSSSEAA